MAARVDHAVTSGTFSLDGETEWGGGLGWRWANDEGRQSVDVLAWHQEYARFLGPCHQFVTPWHRL